MSKYDSLNQNLFLNLDIPLILIVLSMCRLECLSEETMTECMLSDELIRDLDLSSWLIQERAARAGVPPVTRGYTNMLVLAGGEGASLT